MTFELTSFTTVRILDVRTLASKDRKPDEPPGAQLLVQAEMQIAALAMFDPRLPDMLARKADVEPTQGELKGIEVLELTEIGSHVKRIPWVYDQTGCTVEIDRGLGGSSNLILHDCLVHRVSFQVQKGVSVRVQWTIDAPAQSDQVRGKLTGMKATEMPITQVGPEVDGQQDLAPAPPLTPKQLREANAAGQTIEQKAAEVAGAAGMKPGVAWPFPETKGGGPGAKSAPAQDATDAVLADVKKHGAAGRSAAKPAVKSRRPVAAKKGYQMPPAKYRDPQSGQTWSGRGLKPKWLSVALDLGAKLADFEVKGH